MSEHREDTAMGKLTKSEQRELTRAAAREIDAASYQKPSLWQRFKEKLFGGEGRVDDLFK